MNHSASGRPRARWVIGLAVLHLAGQSGSTAVAEGITNPYAYDLSPFKHVAEEWVRFRERAALPVAVEGAQALAADARVGICVGGASEVVILDAAGKPTGRFPIGAAARCLAIGRAGEILVGSQDRVDVYTPAGELSVSWVGLGEKAILTSLAVQSDRVYVADAGNRVVWRFDGSGRLLGSIGASATGGANKHFVIPSPNFDVAAGADGTVWIVNPGERRLEQYAADGRFLTSWGRSGMDIEGFCGCCNPTHLAARADGAWVTAEKGIPRVKLYAREGRLLGVVAAPDQFAEGRVVADLAVDDAGRVLVLEKGAARIRVFSELTGAADE